MVCVECVFDVLFEVSWVVFVCCVIEGFDIDEIVVFFELMLENVCVRLFCVCELLCNVLGFEIEVCACVWGFDGECCDCVVCVVLMCIG